VILLPTIAQIAQLANVSPATVSLVLNEKGSISEETRNRVKRIIFETGYKRQPSGRLIGLIGHIPEALIKSLQQAAAEYGYDAIPMRPEDCNDAEGLGGTMIYGGGSATTILTRQARAHPTILLGGHTRLPYVDSIWVDNVDSMNLALTYLAERGHRCVGLVNGPKRTLTSWEKEAGLRYATVRDAALSRVASVQSNSFRPPDTRAAALEMLRLMPEATALILAESRMAKPVYELLLEHGRMVPDDISLIVFRDAPELTQTNPPLTAIGFSYMDLAREAMRHLVRRINEPKSVGKRILLRPHVVERGSVLDLNAATRIY